MVEDSFRGPVVGRPGDWRFIYAVRYVLEDVNRLRQQAIVLEGR